MPGIYLLADGLLNSQKGVCSMEILLFLAAVFCQWKRVFRGGSKLPTNCEAVTLWDNRPERAA